MILDTVILAGGRGSRLRGVTPTYFKPILVVDGQAMIVHVLREAEKVTSGKIVIVLAPDNAVPIINLLRDSELLDDHVRFIVQPNPTGPGDAYLLAAEMCSTRHTLVLAADNLFGEDDVSRVVEAVNCESPPNVVVGGHRINDPEIAQRFTRLTLKGTYEGPIKDERRESWDGVFYVWLGPLVVDREMMTWTLSSAPRTADGERKIGPHLWQLGGESGQLMVAVDCTTHDVGDLNGGS